MEFTQNHKQTNTGSRLAFLLLFLMSFGSLNAQLPNTLSNAEKVYGLSKFWQEVNYNFVYLNQVDREAWTKEYIDLIDEVQATENDYEYYRLLQKFCALLKDGHTNIFFPNSINNLLYRTNFGEYKLFVENFEGKAIITAVNLSKKEELPVGTEIIKVNGMETKTYLEKEVLPYISSSTEHILMDYAVALMFESMEGTSYDLVLRLPDGKEKNLTLTHATTEEEDVYPEFDDRELLELTWPAEGIAHLSINSFNEKEIIEQFLEILPELSKAEKLIIDLRYNGGGMTSIALEIFQYFTEDEILFGSKESSRLHVPTYKAWGRWTEETDTLNDESSKQAYLSFRDEYYHEFPYEADTIQLKEDRLIVPTTILIGHETASSAEDFLIYTDNQEHMVKVGQPTFGSTGQPMFFELPGGGFARICTKKDTYPDGRLFVGYGVMPDIVVEKTLEDYLASKDIVLEKAIEYLNSK
jgi:C-terminal processing protease CtpA/Prc